MLRPVLIVIFWYLIAATLAGNSDNGLGAGQPYVIDASYPVHPLDEYLEVLADRSGTLSFAALRQLPSANWRPLTEVAGPLGKYEGSFLPLTSKAYFVRLHLRTTEPLDGWQLHLEDRLVGNITWIRGNGRVDVRAYLNEELLWRRVTGADVPSDERDIKGNRVLDRVRFSLPVDTTVTLIVRVTGNSFGFPAYVNATLRAPAYVHYHPLLQRQVTFNIFVLGVMFITLIAHLFLFGFLRERVHAWFAVWLALCTLTQGMTVGLEVADWLPFWFTDLRMIIWLIIPGTMLFTFWLFGRAYVNTPVRYPRLDRYMLGLPLFMLVVTFLEVLAVIFFAPERGLARLPGQYETIATFALAGLVLATVLVTRRDDPLARFFGAGAVVASIGLLISCLWATQAIRLPFDPFAMGMLGQVIIYSAALAYRSFRLARAGQRKELAAERARSEVARMRDLDAVKARFFANVSHEFRTPLALIAGPLDRARKRSLREHGETAACVELDQENFAVVRENTHRLENLVEQLLELSRLEHGGIFLQLRRGGIVDFVRTLTNSFESMADRAGVGLITHFPAACPTAYFDADKLTKIVTNLVTNAIKYTPPQGAVTVAMNCDFSHFNLRVSDTGPGIPDSETGRIFERFYRAEGTEVAGTGIGLALCKELVDLHGGTITVRSTVGQGSTFRVRLPHTLEDLPSAVRAEPAGMPSQTGEFATNGYLSIATEATDKISTSKSDDAHDRPLVLVVEDNTQLRRFISDILSEDYRVLTAEDGKQGERMATEHLPDLVLSDVMMPGQDGYALCHALKSNPKTSHVAVVLLTAKADQNDALAGLMQGADDYLTKPFDADELQLRIRNLLARRKQLWAHFQSLDLTLLPEVDARSLEDQFVQKVAAVITEHLGDEQLGVDTIAQAVGYSRSQLTRKLKALTGYTPNKLVLHIRLNEARRQLERGRGSVSEIAYRVGFSNLSYFAKRFQEMTGILPSAVERERPEDGSLPFEK